MTLLGLVIPAMQLYCIILFLAFGCALLCGFISVHRNGLRGAEDALITIASLNTTFAFALISFSVFVGALSLYWFSHSLELHYIFVGFVLTIALSFILHGTRFDTTGFFLCLLANILFALFSFYFMSAFYDSSFDGRTYHQTAVYYLKNGWLPDKEQLFLRWCNEYPKAPWIWEALVYKLGGCIEGGKCVNCLAVYALFNLALYSGLRLNRSIIPSFIFATLAIANPVVITQFFSFYNDGLLYVYSVSIVLLISLLLLEAPVDKWFIISLLLLTIPFAANIKFTGMVYSYLMLGLAFAFTVVKKRHASLRAVARISILTLVLSFMTIGYNPYWSNVLHGRHLFHPLFGSSKSTIDIILMNNRPHYMNEHNSFYNFASSLLSKVGDNTSLRAPEWRNPLQLAALKEIKSLYIDTRTNGFGPYFVLSLALSILLLVYSACKTWPAGEKKTPLLYMMLAIFFTTVCNKEAWWARYVPHLWFTAALTLIGPSFSKLFSMTRTTIIILCLTTSVLTMYYTVEWNRKATITLQRGIEMIKSTNGDIVVFSQIKDFDTALRALLEDNNLPFMYAAATDNLKPLFVYKVGQSKVVVVCQKLN